MKTKTQSEIKVLIVDDSQFNRDLLTEILCNEYTIFTAKDGKDAIDILKQPENNFAIVLLDIVMPVYDGFYVLDYMHKNKLVDEIPVIIISTESSNDNIKNAYKLGASGYITRPFDAYVIKKRISNTILMYAKQRHLEHVVSDQFEKTQHYMSMMVQILSNIVEFRDTDSGEHTRNIMKLTEILLKQVASSENNYSLSPDDIFDIYYASALHDIGKIAIPTEILGKPGKLTKDEYEIVKTHSQIGANIIASLPQFGKEPFLKTAHDICLYHHERFDGKGYPKGIKGDDIPISAQVVSLVDVYDALTSKRCYKKAYTHDSAMDLILGGECGVFNPILIKCFVQVADEFKKVHHQ